MNIKIVNFVSPLRKWAKHVGCDVVPWTRFALLPDPRSRCLKSKSVKSMHFLFALIRNIQIIGASTQKQYIDKRCKFSDVRWVSCLYVSATLAAIVIMRQNAEQFSYIIFICSIVFSSECFKFKIYTSCFVNTPYFKFNNGN